MTKYGLGRTAWGIVALITLLNWYAIVPALSWPAVAAVALAIPAASFVWVHCLKSILAVWFGGGESSTDKREDDVVESYEL